MNDIFKKDFYRNIGVEYHFFNFLFFFFTRHEIRYLYCYRNKNIFTRLLKRGLTRKYGLEILSDNVGEGLYLGHPYLINVNPEASIGKNCNLAKGVTIGQENRGKRKGTPHIGNEVWIGVNATVVGNINIGDNVLIAPNSYVNIDVESNSIVIGNPCKVIKSANATKDYINYKI